MQIMSNNTSEELVDFIDLINFTLSNDFLVKWRYKYSERFLKLFQLKILEAMSKGSTIKTSTLYGYLTKTCKYSKALVLNFFEAVDISGYSPMIYGRLKI